LPEGKDPDQIIRSSPDAWRQLVAEARPYYPPSREKAQQAGRRGSAGPGEKQTPDAAKSEELCLALLFRFPQLRQQGLGIDQSLFTLMENRELFALWGETPDQETLGQQSPEALYPQFERVMNKGLDAYAKSPEGALSGCIRHLIDRKLELEYEANRAAISEKEQKLGLNRAARSVYTSLNEGPHREEISPDEKELNYLILRNQEILAELQAGRRGAKQTQS
jgi:hypothetical protein